METKIKAKTLVKILSIQEKLREKNIIQSVDLISFLNILHRDGEVEVGWRQTCGKGVEKTRLIFEAWNKVVKLLKKDGYLITEEPQQHKNAYATINGGFWQSTIYKLKN